MTIGRSDSKKTKSGAGGVSTAAATSTAAMIRTMMSKARNKRFIRLMILGR
jgi:hypothetical protein